MASLVGAVSVAALLLASCGGGAGSSPDAAVGGTSVTEPPVITVTTTIWADVVEQIACDGSVQIDTVIPPGGDPHGFEASLSDRAQMERSALVVANGLGLEAGLDDTLAAVSASGSPMFRMADHLETIRRDPHIWFDPRRVATALPALAQAMVENGIVDADTVAGCLEAYTGQLADLDAELAAQVDELPADRRTLVTNHDSLGYFADRYGFRVIGTVIPAASTLAESSPAQLEALAGVIADTGTTAIFAEAQHSTADADALASRVGDVRVVTLNTGTLTGPDGQADSYVDLLRTNTTLIVDALR